MGCLTLSIFTILNLFNIYQPFINIHIKCMPVHLFHFSKRVLQSNTQFYILHSRDNFLPLLTFTFSHFHISTRNCLVLLVLNPNRSFRPSDSCHILTLISVSFFFAGPEPFIRLRFQYPLYFRCTYTDIYMYTYFFASP